MKKITIHFSDKNLKQLKELINIIGIEGYGDVPKALKFSITYTLLKLNEDLKVIPDLNGDDFNYWLSSIKYLKKQKKRVDEITKIEQKN